MRRHKFALSIIKSAGFPVRDTKLIVSLIKIGGQFHCLAEVLHGLIVLFLLERVASLFEVRHGLLWIALQVLRNIYGLTATRRSRHRSTIQRNENVHSHP